MNSSSLIKVISTPKAPAALGPYCQARVYGGLVYCSGSVGMDPTTGELATTNSGSNSAVQLQTRMALKNMENILLAANSSLDLVIKTTVFLKNMSDFPAMNKIYEEIFSQGREVGSGSAIAFPARSTVEVARLPKDALFEIECIAAIKDH